MNLLIQPLLDTKKGSEKTTLRKGDPSKATKSAGEKNVQTPREIPGGNFQKSSYNKGNKGADTAPSVLFVQTIQTWYMDAILRISHQ